MYRTIREPKQRAVIGTSYGANISALISYYHSDIFGKCGLHSSAFQPNNYEALNLLMGSPKKAIDYAAVWGTYESVYQYMRPLRDTLTARGYRLTWQELPEGHSWGLWRATLDNFFRFFFPPLPNVVKDSLVQPESFVLLQAYPNPFNPSCTVRFSIEKPTMLRLGLFDIAGNLLRELATGYYSAGSHSLTVDGSGLGSGLYFIQLLQNGKQKTLPIALIK
jgi:enterochelin esterase family protein